MWVATTNQFFKRPFLNPGYPAEIWLRKCTVPPGRSAGPQLASRKVRFLNRSRWLKPDYRSWWFQPNPIWKICWSIPKDIWEWYDCWWFLMIFMLIIGGFSPTQFEKYYSFSRKIMVKSGKLPTKWKESNIWRYTHFPLPLWEEE